MKRRQDFQLLVLAATKEGLKPEMRRYRRDWPARRQLVLERVQDEQLGKAYSIQSVISAILSLGADGLAQSSLRKQAMDMSQRAVASYVPWVDDDTEPEELTEKDGDLIKQAWNSKFGDMDDPEVQKAIEGVAALLNEEVDEWERRTPGAQMGDRGPVEDFT